MAIWRTAVGTRTNRIGSLLAGALLLAMPAGVRAAEPVITASGPNAIGFTQQQARFVRFLIRKSSSGEPCIDEFEVYGPDGGRNLALKSNGARAAVSSSLAGYSIHQAAHLNDGLYGNDHSWVAASANDEWIQIELPQPAAVTGIVFSRDRNGKYADRVPVGFEVQVSLDGKEWVKAAEVRAPARVAPVTTPPVPVAPLPDPPTWEGMLRYAFLCEKGTWERMNATDHLSPLKTDRPALPGGPPYWSRLASLGLVTGGSGDALSP